MMKEKRNNQSERRRNEKGLIIIMEVDEETHELILKKAKLNIGKKCTVNNINKCKLFINV